MLRIAGTIVAALAFPVFNAPGQITPADAPTATTTTQPSLLEDDQALKWSFSATSSVYVLPDDGDYVAATFIADRGHLHLEGRYNYEDIDTWSVFAGINFSFGEELTLDVTPMLGGVSGNTDGIAPGYEITLAYKQFELYTEGEYVFDLDDSAANFFYSWSELSYYPADWLRVGLVVQRTKVYETDFDIQRGFLAGASYKNVDFTTYVFNPDDDDPTLVFSITMNF